MVAEINSLMMRTVIAPAILDDRIDDIGLRNPTKEDCTFRHAVPAEIASSKPRKTSRDSRFLRASGRRQHRPSRSFHAGLP